MITLINVICTFITFQMTIILVAISPNLKPEFFTIFFFASLINLVILAFITILVLKTIISKNGFSNILENFKQEIWHSDIPLWQYIVMSVFLICVGLAKYLEFLGFWDLLRETYYK